MFDYSNEELAVKILNGKKDLIPQLWAQVEKFVSFKARQYINLQSADRCIHYEADDLIQEGFFAMLAAVKYYKPDSGIKFITYLKYTLKTAFASVAGHRTGKQRNDGLMYSFSADVPVGEEETDTLLSFLPSDEDVEEQITDSYYNQQLHNALMNTMNTLSEKQKAILVNCYFNKKSDFEMSEMYGCTKANISDQRRTALKRLYQEREKNGLTKFLAEQADYYGKVGVRQFNNTWQSAVEKTVLKRERLTEKWLKKHYKTTKKKGCT